MRYSEFLFLALFTATATSAAILPANADDVTVRRTTVVTPGALPVETIYAPGMMVQSPTTTVTKRTVVTEPLVTPLSSTTVTRSTVLNNPVLEPLATTTTKRTVVTESTGPVTTESFISAESSGPIYNRRLSRMYDQINMGLAKGWLTPGQADHLVAEHNRIADMIATRGPGIEQSDAIESRLNLLNLAIQDDFSINGQTAGLGHSY